MWGVGGWGGGVTGHRWQVSFWALMGAGRGGWALPGLARLMEDQRSARRHSTRRLAPPDARFRRPLALPCCPLAALTPSCASLLPPAATRLSLSPLALALSSAGPGLCRGHSLPCPEVQLHLLCRLCGAGADRRRCQVRAPHLRPAGRPGVCWVRWGGGCDGREQLLQL